ncbi:hypothetical protein PT277_07825 [Acetobacteraceae bacterium ESL0709]|nr:hypothetical protein [Acetobacteraceae bacterium ESL0697]MDF7678587.1 hypothetical protein [Acetobacteraceae bacterium ESL0709]
MAGNNTPFDPKELRLLADILALVLDDEVGQAEAALERLRQRAKQQSLSGGALKNLIITLAENSNGRVDLLRKRHEAEIKHYQEETEHLAAQHRDLQKYVSFLERDNQILRYNSQQQYDLPWPRIRVVIALITGLLIGIALSQVVHSINSSHMIDRSLCSSRVFSNKNQE